MADHRVQIIVDAVDHASVKLKSVGRSLTDFGAVSKLSTGQVLALGAAVTGVAAGLVAFGRSAISSAAGMEQTNVAFRVMLGSAQKADEFIRDMVQFAKTTPFELKGLEESAKRLLAYGFAQEEIIPNLKTLGDISAGVGSEKLPQLILAFGQVKAATRLTGMELRQFSEAGVPMLGELAKNFGKTAGEIQDMVSKGEIGFGDVQKALEGMTGEGGRFFNLMNEQSRTLNGRISNLRDAFDILMRAIGGPLLGAAGQLVLWLTAMTQRTQELVGWLVKHKEIAIAIALVFTGMLLGAFTAVAVGIYVTLLPAIMALTLALAPYLLTGAIIGGMIFGLYELVKHWTTVWNFIKTHLLAITAIMFPPLYLFIEIGKKLGIQWQDVRTVLEAVWEAIKLAFQIGVDAVLATLQPFISTLNTIIDLAAKAYKAIRSLSGGAIGIGGGIGGLGLPRFQSGGMVGGPLGAPQLAVVHGGERVIPNSGLRSPGGGGITVNISGNNIASDLDITVLAERVGKEIMRSLRMAQAI